MLTKRQRNIVLYLAKQESFITVEQIAGEFEVSARTVRNDLDGISQFLLDNGIQMEKKPRLGIRIQVEHDMDWEALFEVENSGMYDQQERIYLILTRLILREKVTLDELESILNISRNTVVTDVKAAEQILILHGIDLNKRSYVGMNISGDEELIRNFLFNIYVNMSGQLSIDPVKVILDLTGQCAEYSVKLIRYIEERSGIQYADEALYELQAMLSASLYRAGFGKHPKESRMLLQIKTDPVYKIVQEFVTEYLKIKLKQGDLCYLTMILCSTKSISDEDNGIMAERWSDSVCREIIQSFLEELGIERTDGNLSEKQFYEHLRTAVFRLQNHIRIVNPLMQEIQYTSSFMYELAERVLKRYEDKLWIQFPAAEIAYVTVYLEAFFQNYLVNTKKIRIIVVCNGGIATSTLLKQRIAMYLPELPVLGSYRAADIASKVKEIAPDLILTTVPLKLKGYRIIQVNPLLLQEDIRKIMEQLMKISYNHKTSHLIHKIGRNSTGKISAYLPEENCQFQQEIKDWQEAIRKAAVPLLRKRQIEPRYVDDMIKVVQNMGNYMVFIPEIAFVHAHAEYVHETSIALLNLAEAIPFGTHGKDQVKTIIVIANKEENYILSNLINVLQKNNNIEKFKQSECYQDILELEE